MTVDMESKQTMRRDWKVRQHRPKILACPTEVKVALLEPHAAVVVVQCEHRPPLVDAENNRRGNHFEARDSHLDKTLDDRVAGRRQPGDNTAGFGAVAEYQLLGRWR